VGPTFPGGDTEDLQEELDNLKLEKSTLEKRLKELQERQKAGLKE
jgi:predicted  nucleic acid-binding Zn-ribbon protein